MRTTMTMAAISAAALAMIALLLSATKNAHAQSGSRRAQQAQAHYDTLWAWLQRSDYRRWKGVDGLAPDFQEGHSPHGALIKTFVNGPASKDLKHLPSGSVIVKENYSPDKKLMAVTIMQRSKGFDPEHGDWYYAKYAPNGKIDKTPPEMKSMPIAGKFKMCIDCHSGAGGGDFAFLND